MTRRPMLIDPSGRPLKRAGFEAAYALGLVIGWVILMGALFALIGQNQAAAGPWPSAAFCAVGVLAWALAEIVAGRQHLVWPGSALGIVGPLSVGFAVALSTPELREGPHLTRIAVVATVAGIGMIPFLFRFRLPGLVSPIITFSLVGLFLGLYGADMERLKEVEGFSPRGLVAALMTEPLFGALFGVMALGATWMARKLDLSGDNFGLAAARPLHLVGGGVVALVLGRILAELPHPADLIALSLAWIGAMVWTMRVNRVAVMFAAHFAMAKPMIYAATEPFGITLSLREWSLVLTYILLFDMLIWPFLHLLSARIGFTLGPGGRAPPDRSGAMWRYWPYATDEQLDRWAANRAERRKKGRGFFQRLARLFGAERKPRTDPE